jgi:hypothetical protein
MLTSTERNIFLFISSLLYVLIFQLVSLYIPWDEVYYVLHIYLFPLFSNFHLFGYYLSYFFSSYLLITVVASVGLVYSFFISMLIVKKYSISSTLLMMSMILFFNAVISASLNQDQSMQQYFVSELKEVVVVSEEYYSVEEESLLPTQSVFELDESTLGLYRIEIAFTNRTDRTLHNPWLEVSSSDHVPSHLVQCIPDERGAEISPQQTHVGRFWCVIRDIDFFRDSLNLVTTGNDNLIAKLFHMYLEHISNSNLEEVVTNHEPITFTYILETNASLDESRNGVLPTKRYYFNSSPMEWKQ